MKTLIVGKNSNFSNALKQVVDANLISSIYPKNDLAHLNLNKSESINIIFNNFQKSTLLGDLASPERYIQRSIMSTAEVFEYLLEKKITLNKVIYTSSSSVYGNNNFCHESDQVMPLNLHASLKVANERFIQAYCDAQNIDFTICRVFNMYGGHDEFSIISKIINASIEKRALTLYNNGNAIRDFIHIEDAVIAYRHILSLKNIPIINIGTSIGVSIKSLIDMLKHHGVILHCSSLERKELKVSTADITLLKQLIPDLHFHNLEKYILSKVLESD